MAVNRREAITGISAAAAAGAGMGLMGATSSLAAVSGGMDLTSPGGRQRTFMMVKGALDERLIIRWIQTRYYAVIDASITPMYNTHSATFARHRRLTDGRYAGGYEMVSGEIAWYTDLVTGKPVDIWYNPYIDRKVDIPEGGLSAMRSVIGSDLSVHVEHQNAGMDFVFEVLPFDQRANDLWVTELLRGAAPAREGQKPFRYSQNSVYRTRVSDLSKQGAQHVTSDISFTNISSWRPYLQMGDHPGHMMSMGVGQQGATFDSISEEWKAVTRERRPAVFKDPSSMLASVWETRGDWR